MLRGYNYKYINGNYLVTSKGQDLSKTAFRIGEDLVANFPDSIDLKISNRCSRGCAFCHENSVKTGKILNIQKTIEKLSQLPSLPIEIAIGGGNILECVPESNEIVDWLISRGHRVRCTIKYEDLLTLTEEQRSLLKKFEGIGISIDKLDKNLKAALEDSRATSFLYETHEVGMGRLFTCLLNGWDIVKVDPIELHGSKTAKFVTHIIAGVFPIKDLKNFLENTNIPVLILGFKQWGRAINNKLPETLDEFESIVKQYIYGTWRKQKDQQNSEPLVFDNLSLEQLRIKDALVDEEWESLYMGDEGMYSMYIDAVEGQYARDSRSPKRISWDEIGLIDYFKSLRNDSGNN